MSRPKARKFVSTSAKDYVRDVLDRNIIEEFRAHYFSNQPLSYFGLPGEAMLDILSWRDHIGRATAVQIAETQDDREVADELERTIFENHLEGVVNIVRSDIDMLLTTPAMRERLRWPFQIVNLDYYGGLVNATRKGTSRRMDAIRSLFAAQMDQAFVLFLTFNLRDADRGELSGLIDKVEDMLSVEYENVSECLSNHRKLGHAGELKVYVPIFLANEARRHSLAFRQPILYEGTRQMIHFAVECVPYSDLILGRISEPADLKDLVNLGLLVLGSDCALKQTEELGQIT